MSASFPMVQLGNLLQHRSDFIEIDDFASYKRCRVQLHAQGIVERDAVQGAELKIKKQQVCRTNEFLVAEIDAKLGGFGIVPESLDGAIVSSHYFLFTIDGSALDHRFLNFYIRTPAFMEQVRAKGTTNYAAIRPKDVLQYEIPLPLPEEQRRIVARIEELASKIEEARRLRQKVEAEAEALLSSMFTAAYNEARKFVGKLERLDDLCLTITDGTHVTPTYVSEGIPFLSVKDITTGQIRFDEAKFISPEEHVLLTKRCKPERDDVLLTKVGTTGFAKAIDVDREFSIFVSLALLKLDKRRLHPKYTEYMLNSSQIRKHSEEGTRGVGNKNLVLKFIKEFPIPAPPLPEQKRIVAYLDNLQAQADRLKHTQSETSAELDALLPSILDKAFKGEL
ncbi:MAG: restriction endonuclease subunit S [Ktedonobacteraceae bacterium]